MEGPCNLVRREPQAPPGILSPDRPEHVYNLLNPS
jgi:hypothetical protein